jgi:hypothetical protein
MAQTLWGAGTKRRKQRRKRREAALPSHIPYSVTGDDCAVLGHTLNAYDLSGCTSCMDCGARIFCPQCIPRHPAGREAVPVLCPRHECPRHEESGECA